MTRETTPPRWTAAGVARVLQAKTFSRCALIPNTTWPGAECDLLLVDQHLRLLEIEIKVSRADFKADRTKSKWWDREWVGSLQPHGDGYHRTPVEWPRRIARHYYALPASIWHEDLLEFLPSEACGVVLVGHRRGPPAYACEVIRRAKPNPDPYVLTMADLQHLLRLMSFRIWADAPMVEEFCGPPERAALELLHADDLDLYL